MPKGAFRDPSSPADEEKQKVSDGNLTMEVTRWVSFAKHLSCFSMRGFGGFW